MRTLRGNVMSKSARDAIVTAARRFGRDEGAATAIEYAVIASGISIVIVGAVTTLGTNVKSLFTSVSTVLN